MLTSSAIRTVRFEQHRNPMKAAGDVAREEANSLSIDVEQYYEKYGPMVLRRCKALLRNDADAYDAMQEVFVKVLAKQDSLTDKAPSSLLYRIATNTCLNRLRSKRRKPEHPDEELLMNIAAATDPEARSVARRVLDAIFKDEKESTAAIAVMHLLDGMTLKEVADAVDMSVSGVRKRLRKLKGRVDGLEL